MSDGQSIRTFLTALEQRGELVRIDKRVEPRFELSAFLSLADPGPAVLFEDVAGGELKVVGNLLNSRRRVAEAIGCPVSGISAALHKAISRPVKPRLVAPGPAQSVVVRDHPLAGLPVPIFFERE